MQSHCTKVALSAVGVVAMLTSFTFAQKQQYISHVNQSGLFEVLKAAAASGGELPQYEVMGFPISAHQMSVSATAFSFSMRYSTGLLRCTTSVL